MKAKYIQQSLKSEYRRTKKIKSTKEYQKIEFDLFLMTIKESGSQYLEDFSAKAKLAYSKFVDSVTSPVREGTTRITYNDGFLQIFRIVTTTVQLDGKGGSISERTLVDFVPVSKPKSHKELKQMAEDYMKDQFGGKAKQNTFKEEAHTCIK